MKLEINIKPGLNCYYSNLAIAINTYGNQLDESEVFF